MFIEGMPSCAYSSSRGVQIEEFTVQETLQKKVRKEMCLKVS